MIRRRRTGLLEHVRARRICVPLVVAFFVVCLVASTAAPAGAYTIRLGQRNTVSRMGPWSMSDPTLRRAIQVFGLPSSEHAVHPGFAGTSVADCSVTWSRIGLHV